MIQKIIENELLLNLISREEVSWILIKLVSSYKYVRLLG